MVIVGGVFELDPAERDAFVASRMAMMRASRQEPGCLEYTFAPDPLVAGRVVLFERWESQAALDAHLAALRGADPAAETVVPISASITIHEVAGERRL